MQFSVIEKKAISKVSREKVKNFTFNPYILDNFAYTMEQSLDSDKGH